MNIWVVLENMQREDVAQWASDSSFFEQIALAGHTPILVVAGDTVASYVNGRYEFSSHIGNEILPIPMPDCVITRTGADTRKATFGLYNIFEKMGIPVVNSSASVALAADKIETAIALADTNLPCPDFLIAGPRANSQQIINKLGLPVVAKNPVGTCGTSVFLLKTKHALEAFMQKNLQEDPEGDAGLKFQRYIQKSHGRDYRLLVVGGEVVATVERKSPSNDFRANASLGGTMVPFEPTQEMREIATAASNVLGLNIAGVDILDGDNGPLICEVNSAPGVASTQHATGKPLVNIMVSHILQVAEHQRANQSRKSFLMPTCDA